MSLITCCPNCRTLFKVVADQLKVSDGWVRCGHCDGVFDASAHFQATEESEPLEATEADAQDASPPALEALADVDVAAMSAPMTLPTAASLPDAAVDEFSRDFVDRLNSPVWPQAPVAPRLVAPSSADDASVSAPLSSYLSAPEVTDFLSQDDHARNHDVAGLPALHGSTKTIKPSNSVKAEDVRRPPLADVTFVQAAQHSEKSQGSLYRVLGVLAALTLLGALAFQVLLHERDGLAARYPAMLPVLEGLCQTMDCQINPPRVIEAITIDSSSFTQTGLDAYRLNVVLKNTQSRVVAMPALEVTLTGSQNEILVRKVLLPAEFGAIGNRLEQSAPFSGVFNLLVSLPSTAIAPQQPASSAPNEDATSAGPTAVAVPPTAAPIIGYRLFAFYP
jgi:predicted Zn finger-like uncharacterized protein